ncbi:aspartate--ammonia ligase [Ureaplasma sp. ES3154-GEN]|uniref:aspartate--ammonia ligase n=1 Tax=Ureaplasma sp. ES3154-GEN TaxID=2984844 RepID=UPI0021E8EC31|nr:aspartate--ammonia ligase [Ureaplasma sp. ES3154-GEN]MCV3743586.1 aspartate--ammonia ligase [Ureaplasma sp. ES3154-GEN]
MISEAHKKINLVQKQIMVLKNSFQTYFQNDMKMVRVTAPLFVTKQSGFNDELDGKQQPVTFHAAQINLDLQIVQSLAKWKRYALQAYEFDLYEGLYTDMNAIRADDEIDHKHSIYVDQWDWEQRITANDRNQDYLQQTVKQIFDVLKKVENDVCKQFNLEKQLPDDLFFITSQQLEDLYPNLTPDEREYQIVKKHHAVFIMQIGYPLKSNVVHSMRSPSYDDWTLNGDLVVYHQINDEALELMSMGIRVDAKTFSKQTNKTLSTPQLSEYEQLILKNQLPYSIGGGIGQSRLCMFFLHKQHIGEVQASAWTTDYINLWKKRGVKIL